MKNKKVLKIILIVLGILIIGFVANWIRKIYIIEQYNKNIAKYDSVTNFYRKIIDGEENIEIWRKSNLALYKISEPKDEKMIYWGEDAFYMISNTVDENNNVKKVAAKFHTHNAIIPGIAVSAIQTNSLIDSIIVALRTSITTENVDGKECYKIQIDKGWEEYISKEDFFIVKNINGGVNTVISQYEINTVTDDDVKMPDLEGYVIEEVN